MADCKQVKKPELVELLLKAHERELKKEKREALCARAVSAGVKLPKAASPKKEKKAKSPKEAKEAKKAASLKKVKSQEPKKSASLKNTKSPKKEKAKKSASPKKGAVTGRDMLAALVVELSKDTGYVVKSKKDAKAIAKDVLEDLGFSKLRGNNLTHRLEEMVQDRSIDSVVLRNIERYMARGDSRPVQDWYDSESGTETETDTDYDSEEEDD
jgi:hypothetical protein